MGVQVLISEILELSSPLNQLSILVLSLISMGGLVPEVEEAMFPIDPKARQLVQGR